MMRRRDLIAMLGATIAGSGAAQSDERSRRRLGVLTTTSETDAEWQAERAAFTSAISAFGWREGQNLKIDYRFAAGEPMAFPALARDLVALKPDVLLARSTLPVRALMAETRTIPIVFISVSDPLGENFAATMARPGGNVTGFTNFEASIAGKWLELLRQITPGARRVGLLFNPSARVFFMPQMAASAAALGLVVQDMPMLKVEDLEDGIAAFAREPNGAILILADVFTVANRKPIIELAALHRLPALYTFRNMAVEGGLMSYGVNVTDIYRRSAEYVRRILRGESAGELPIQTPTSFELLLNLKTAKALGLTIPSTLLASADEVIE
jgi:putative ABC transport system substrate-binding protein